MEGEEKKLIKEELMGLVAKRRQMQRAVMEVEEEKVK